jgi:hypothetical protein
LAPVFLLSWLFAIEWALIRSAGVLPISFY